MDMKLIPFIGIQHKIYTVNSPAIYLKLSQKKKSVVEMVMEICCCHTHNGVYHKLSVSVVVDTGSG